MSARRGRRPLVYATKSVLLKAERLAPNVVLEERVADAIEEGAFRGSDRAGQVVLDELQLVAKVVRRPGAVRERPRAWLIQALTPSASNRRSHAHHAA